MNQSRTLLWLEGLNRRDVAALDDVDEHPRFGHRPRCGNFTLAAGLTNSSSVGKSSARPVRLTVSPTSVPPPRASRSGAGVAGGVSVRSAVWHSFDTTTGCSGECRTAGAPGSVGSASGLTRTTQHSPIPSRGGSTNSGATSGC